MSNVVALLLPIARNNQKHIQDQLNTFPLPTDLASRLVLDYWLYRKHAPVEAEQEILSQVYDLIYNDHQLYSDIVDTPDGDEAAALKILTKVQKLTHELTETLNALHTAYPAQCFSYLKLVPTPIGVVVLLCPSK